MDETSLENSAVPDQVWISDAQHGDFHCTVTVTYSIETVPKLGQVTPVVLQFDGVTHFNGAIVRLSTDGGLSVLGPRRLALPAGKRTAATVFLVCESEGLSCLDVFVTQGAGMSAISVPIQTGTKAAVMNRAAS